jgi:hypothetical protein
MTLAEKLAQRIAVEDAEIARIQADAVTNVQAAEVRKATLQEAQAILDANPGIEPLIAALHRMGIEI